MNTARLPCFVVVEDGHEYTDRFQRFLGTRFSFQRAGDGQAAIEAIGQHAPHGLLLDLDFKRTAPHLLWTEGGPARAHSSKPELLDTASVQGILILRNLRRMGINLPALLFADLDDAPRADLLRRELAPVEIVSSQLSLVEIAAALTARVGQRPEIP